MVLEITKDGGLLLKEVFNGVGFETEEGESLSVCMRDGGFEIGIIDKKDIMQWFLIKDGKINLLAKGKACKHGS